MGLHRNPLPDVLDEACLVNEHADAADDDIAGACCGPKSDGQASVLVAEEQKGEVVLLGESGVLGHRVWARPEHRDVGPL